MNNRIEAALDDDDDDGGRALKTMTPSRNTAVNAFDSTKKEPRTKLHDDENDDSGDMPNCTQTMRMFATPS